MDALWIAGGLFVVLIIIMGMRILPWRSGESLDKYDSTAG